MPKPGTSCFPFRNMVIVKTGGIIGILYIPLYLIIIIPYFSVSVKCSKLTSTPKAGVQRAQPFAGGVGERCPGIVCRGAPKILSPPFSPPQEASNEWMAVQKGR